MWSLLSSFEIGRKSLVAQQAGLQVVSNNIANVNTPGYHREHVDFEASAPEQTVFGQIGTGVDVGTVESVRDQYLEARINQSTQDTSKNQTIVSYLGQVETAFGPNSGLQDGISKFFNSFSTLAADPTSPAYRYGVVSAAQNMTSMFRSASQQLAGIEDVTNSAVSASVGEINGLTAKIADLNRQIAGAEVGGTQATTLRDQRSVALNQLASDLDIHYFEATDGSVSVSTGAGQPLVTAGFVQPLAASQNPLMRVMAGNTDITSTIQGGKLGGLLQVRDQIIPGYQRDLDTLAQSIITQVNAVQQGGKDLQSPPTSPPVNFFNPAPATAGAASSFAVSSAVAGDPQYIAAGRSGAPGDNANALAFQDLATQKFLAGGTQAFSDAFAALQFKVGTDQQQATAGLDAGNALLTQLNNAQDAESGVSLDEEAIDLVRYQRAYQAASKFISVMDQLTEDLINAFGV